MLKVNIKNYQHMIKRVILGSLLIVFALLKGCDMCDLLHWNWLWQQPWTEYVGPVATLYLGGDFLHRGFRHSHDRWLQHPVPEGDEGRRIHCDARFGGDEYIYHGETFHGACLRTHCGAVRLDLREAVIREDEEIDIRNFLGGVELLVPDSVGVIITSRNFIGGVGDETVKHTTMSSPCLHIVANNFIGGVSIRN